MKKLLLAFFFIFLAITVFPIEPVKIVAGGLKTLEIDYWLDTYFDFATGESFTEKRDGKSNELIWRKQNEKEYRSSGNMKNISFPIRSRSLFC